MSEKSKVSIKIYDSNKDDSADFLEVALSEIYSDPDKYEIISMDKSITPAGSFVCAVIYREIETIDETDDELEIVVDENGDIISDNYVERNVKRPSKPRRTKKAKK